MRKPVVILAKSLLLLCIFANAYAERTVYAGDVFRGTEAREVTDFKKENKALFKEGKYSTLEQRAKKYRSEDQCFSNGQSKLYNFYLAISTLTKQEEHADPYRVNQPGEEGVNEAYEKQLLSYSKWAKKFPDSITERVAEANAWIKYAWYARGSGYANTVSDEGWKLFGERLQKAFALLIQKPQSPADDDPQRYNELLIFHRAQRTREQNDAIFSEAVSRYPAFYPFYTERAEELMPRWAGSEGEWLKFADDAVEMTPKSEGMFVYTYIVMYTYMRGEWKNFEQDGVSWPKMKQGFIDYERNHPGSKRYLNQFAYFAVIAGDRDFIAKHGLFKKIGNKPSIEVWGTEEYYEQARNWASCGLPR